MEGFKIEDVKLCYELKVFIRCLETAFKRSDFQKFLMCLVIKKCGREFVSKHVVEHLKHSAKLLKHSADLLKT